MQLFMYNNEHFSGSGKISVKWDKENHTAEFDPEFLLEHSYDLESLKLKRTLSKPKPNTKVGTYD